MTKSTPEPPGGEQSGRAAPDLRSSLSNLADLISAVAVLEELLAQVATFAVHDVAGAEGAAVTLLRVEPAGYRVQEMATSHRFVSDINEIQYNIVNEGPCITAALHGQAVRSGSLGGETLWPRFGARVGRMGVHSALAMPLLLPNQTVGAISVYARNKDAFNDRAVRQVELLARLAAVAVHHAEILAEAGRLTNQLQHAFATRPVIDQAIGLIRGRSGVSGEEAFARLRQVSQREHVKLAVVAQRIIDDAVGHARARQRGP